MPPGAIPYECIHRLFEAQAAIRPDQPALIVEAATLSYGELNRRANQLAHRLQALGVGPDTLVGICVERSPELVIGLLAILKAGGAYLPLDPLFPRERLQFMLHDAGARVLITTERLRAALPPAATVISLDADAALLAAQPEHNPSAEVSAEHLAYISYTSGSTGQPKGSAIPHRSIVGFMFGVEYARFDETQVWLHYSSVSWDALTLELWPALLHGGRCVLYPPQLPTPQEVGAAVERYGITIMWLTSSLFNALIDTQPETLRGLRQLLIGGEALSVAHVRRALTLLPETHIINGYGPSECTVFACCYPIPRTLPDTLTSIPIGRPIGDRRVYLLDAAMQRAPIGIPGELYIGGPALLRGYHNRPALTAEKLVPHPLSKEPGARLYRTGDLARYRADGLIEFVGRADQQVKIRGFRIEIEEIEAALGQHPAVRANVVIVREDPSPSGGSPEKRLVAYVVGIRDQGSGIGGSDGLETGALRSFLKERLPEYLIPSAFVRLEALPLTANGKIDRAALPAPPQARPELAQAFVAPRTPLEELLAAIWADVLGLDQVGVDDQFFDLGGQSLFAAQVMARIRAACGVELPLRVLFEYPSVAELAEHLTQTQQGAAAPPLLPAPRAPRMPLSFAQQRLWFLDQLDPHSPLYNVPAAVTVSGPLDPVILQRCVEQIVARHETLRTTFAGRAEEPAQIIHPTGSVPFQTHDLRRLSAQERAAAVERLALADAHQPFDLQQGPLVRLAALQLAADEHVLLLNMHHIIADGWSMSVLTRELAALYQAALAEPSPADPLRPAGTRLAVQYADYAVWQRQWLEGEILDQQLRYWREQLADAPARLALPTDYPRPAQPSYRGAAQPIALGADLTDALQRLSRREDVTLFMTLLAAFDVLLHWLSKQDDILVGAPIAGRGRVELEPLIGMFVNTLVLRARLGGDPPFQALLQQVRATTLGAYAHQDLPFERLVEALQPERTPGHTPLFQVWFVLQNTPPPTIELPGLTFRPLPLDYQLARYDLRLGLAEEPDGLRGTLEYSADLFKPATIAGLAELWTTLLAAVVREPELRLSELRALLDAAQQERLRTQQQTLKAANLQRLRQAARRTGPEA